MQKIRKLYMGALDMLYPRRCPLCHEILPDPRRLVCIRCESRIRPIRQPRCMKCGKPVAEEQEYCRSCREEPGVYEAGRGIFLYNGMWRRSIVRYKYYGCREYGEFYAWAVVKFGENEIHRWRPQVLVPIPLHPRKQKQRGFNQAELLAQGISRRTGIPVDTGLLKKTMRTRSQKKLDKRSRRKNLQDAFLASERAAGKRILLIDDVYTTGSTIDAAAGCLLQQGAAQVFFLTVCIGAGAQAGNHDEKVLFME